MPLPRDVFYLSDDQFNKLVDLLTPGFECAKLMLAQHAAAEAAKVEPTEAKPTDEAAAKEPAQS